MSKVTDEVIGYYMYELMLHERSSQGLNLCILGISVLCMQQQHGCHHRVVVS